MKFCCFPADSVAMRSGLMKHPVCSAAGLEPPRVGGLARVERVRDEMVKKQVVVCWLLKIPKT